LNYQEKLEKISPLKNILGIVLLNIKTPHPNPLPQGERE
jgi:hypothetical protein